MAPMGCDCIAAARAVGGLYARGGSTSVSFSWPAGSVAAPVVITCGGRRSGCDPQESNADSSAAWQSISDRRDGPADNSVRRNAATVCPLTEF